MHRPKISALAATATLLVAIAIAPACAASQRADTLQTAQIVVTTAGADLLVYDKQHQEALARSGTPDEAAESLKAYRAKRAKVDLALSAAADAIMVAATLNDQPSLEGLAKAIAEVARDYLDLKGLKP